MYDWVLFLWEAAQARSLGVDVQKGSAMGCRPCCPLTAQMRGTWLWWGQAGPPGSRWFPPSLEETGGSYYTEWFHCRGGSTFWISSFIVVRTVAWRKQKSVFVHFAACGEVRSLVHTWPCAQGRTGQRLEPTKSASLPVTYHSEHFGHGLLICNAWVVYNGTCKMLGLCLAPGMAVTTVSPGIVCEACWLLHWPSGQELKRWCNDYKINLLLWQFKSINWWAEKYLLLR